MIGFNTILSVALTFSGIALILTIILKDEPFDYLSIYAKISSTK